ncbi:MAG: peptide-methionine (S)-S-oxide reductase MsrA [Pseudomonadota bacterium]
MNKISTVTALLMAILSLPLQAADTNYEKAILAGGCFWCIESDFEKLKGVVDVVSGYTGGKIANPTYQQVSAGGTGHIEAVAVTYDPSMVSYAEILDYFWRHIDPTRDDGQFCDRGSQYRPAIFYTGAEQQSVAEKSMMDIQHGKPFPDEIKVELIAATTFYLAEDYHQDYHHKNPLRYKYYRYSCGRDKRVAELWGDA